MIRLRLLLLACLVLIPSAHVRAAQEDAWIDTIGHVAIQHQGRTMPLDTFAKLLAVELTGRSYWGKSRGPEAFAGKHRVELLCDLLFRTQEIANSELVAIDDRRFKERVGLDPNRRFFSPVELAGATAIREIVNDYHHRRHIDPRARPSRHERLAQDVIGNFELIIAFHHGPPLQIVPQRESEEFLAVSTAQRMPGTEHVQAALLAFGRAYIERENVNDTADALVAAVNANVPVPADVQRRVGLEVFYNNHKPFRLTAIAYGLALAALGLARVALRRPMLVIAGLLLAWGTAEQLLGLYLRAVILERVPVSNTYEVLLWMGLVAIAAGLIAQLISRKGWYLTAGLITSALCMLFAMLVPLQDQSNALPPVLRSNYWLVVHVVTIVSSYAVLALAAVLGHVYLVKSVLLGKPEDVSRTIGHPLITQLYRSMQIGLVLLTAGTILGGVWAADSWGRFWGWDPKETWAAISIVVYFIILHARHVGWLRDFGMAAWSILAFLCIVWTFYGVNYVMASGLHSYGFGSGGEVWVGTAVLAEIVFLVICKIRHQMLRRGATRAELRAEAD